MSEEPVVVFEWDGEGPLPDDVPRPGPATNFIPEWYKKLPTKNDGVRTVKLCSSFSDALRMGYIIPIPYDFEFSVTGDSVDADFVDSEESAKSYGAAQPELAENSSFERPEVRIDNPWKIHTPDGYSTLITYPMNQFTGGVKPYSLFVDTDSHDDRIPIPASLTQESDTIERGTAFLQVIPVHRDGILTDYEVTSGEQSPDLRDYWEHVQQCALSVNGFYRRFCWEPKSPCFTTDLTDTTSESGSGTEVNAEGSVDAEGLVGGVSEPEFNSDPPHIPKIITVDENYGIVPEPTDMDAVLPLWITDDDGLPDSDEEDRLIQTWARNAMQLGWTIPIISDVRFQQSEGGKLGTDAKFVGELQRGWTGSTSVTSQHPEEQVGKDFPRVHYSIVKISSPWFVCTPPGYSTLAREPFNHRQQLIRGYAGYVDSDRYVVDGNIIGHVELPPGEYEIPAQTPGIGMVSLHRDAILTNSVITH